MLKVLPAKNRLIVEGVNMIKRHTQARTRSGTSRAGSSSARRRAREQRQLVCPECGKLTRIGHKMLGDGRKVRICRKCEGVVDK